MRRATLCLLALACVAGIASSESVNASRKIRLISVDKPKAPTSCNDNKDKHDCLHLGAQEGDCAWCEGDYMPASCMSVSAAKYLPETVAKCKLPKKQQQVAAKAADADNKQKGPNTPKSCGDNKEKHDCLHLGTKDADCAWCAGNYISGSCLSTFASKFIPGMVAKCKLPKKHKTEGTVDSEDYSLVASSYGPGGGSYGPGGGGYGPGGGDWPGGQGGCDDLKSRKKCLKGTKDEVCAWCEGTWQGDACVSEKMADSYKYFAKCKIGKKHKKHEHKALDDDDEESGYFAESDRENPAVSVVLSVTATDAASSDSYSPGGGSYGPGGGGYGPGGGDWPGGQGGCDDLKSKKKCLKGTKDEVCAWCEGSYTGDTCVSEAMAESHKYFAKCKIGKKHKKNEVATS